jgi:hypothetical protein
MQEQMRRKGIVPLGDVLASRSLDDRCMRNADHVQKKVIVETM